MLVNVDPGLQNAMKLATHPDNASPRPRTPSTRRHHRHRRPAAARPLVTPSSPQASSRRRRGQGRAGVRGRGRCRCATRDRAAVFPPSRLCGVDRSRGYHYPWREGTWLGAEAWGRGRVGISQRISTVRMRIHVGKFSVVTVMILCAPPARSDLYIILLRAENTTTASSRAKKASQTARVLACIATESKLYQSCKIISNTAVQSGNAYLKNVSD